MQYITLNDARVAYFDKGEGTPVLFAHCSSASHKQWQFSFSGLAPHYRILAPDLLGYGDSSPWPEQGCVSSDIDAIEAIIAKIARPLHLVGHSYGGAVCLEVARRAAHSNFGMIKSMFLVEPVPFHLLRTTKRDKDWQKIATVANKCISATAKNQPQKAANSYMGFWLGPLKWRLAPRRFREEVIRTISKVAHEFQSMFEYDSLPDEYANIQCPVTLVYGGRSPKLVPVMINILNNVLPHNQLIKIPSAGHMSPFTHKNQISELIQSHLG